MPENILNINSNNRVAPGQIVNIQFEDINPVKLFGEIATGIGGNSYPLEHINWNSTSKVWTVKIPSYIELTPDNNQNGFALRVYFNHAQDNQTPVNVAPIVSSVVSLMAISNDSTSTVSQTQLLQFSSDANGDALTVSNVVANSGTVVNNFNNTWTITPANNFVGTVTLSYTVADGELQTQANAVMVVTGAIDDQAPVVVAPLDAAYLYVNGSGGLAHSELNALINSATVSDNFGDNITIQNDLANNPNPLTASFTLTFTAQDAAGNEHSDSTVITITEAALTNNAPIISNQSLNVQELSNLTITLGAQNDVDGDALTYTVTGSNDFSFINAYTISFNSNMVGVQTLNITADDNNGGIDTATITVNVAAIPNVAPNISNQSLTIQEQITLLITLGPLSDGDGDVIAYAVTGSDDFTQTSANTISFNSNSVGGQTLNITADDGNGGTDNATISVNVTAKPNTAPVISNQSFNVEQQESLVITLGPLVDSDGDSLIYSVTGSSDITPLAANTITFNSGVVGNQVLNVSVDDSNGGTDSSTINISVTALLSQPIINNTVSNVNQNVEKIHTLGPATNGNGETITYTITPADFTVTANTVAINASTGGSFVYTVTANDGDGPDVTANLTINVIASQAEPSLIDFVGWSLLFNSNNGDSTLPYGVDYGSIPQLTATMFLADGINHTLNNSILGGGASIEGLASSAVLNFISNSNAQAIVLSGHSQSSGQDPSGPPTWIDEADTAANAVSAAGKKIIWYQGWLHNDDAEWGGTNVQTNFENLKATHGGTIIKTYQALDRLRINNPEYFNLIENGYVVPSVELWADNAHGTFAMYYMAAACVYRAMTGKLTSSMLYSVPDHYGLPSAFKAAIDDAVDFVQDDVYPGITLQEYGTAYLELWAAAGTDQGIDSPNGQAVNYLNLGANTNIALVDKNGNQTGINFTIPEIIFGGSQATQAPVGENSGFLPDVLMNSVDFHNGGSIAVTLTGLVEGKEYNFKGTASREGGAGRNQDWEVGGNNFAFEAGNNRDLGVDATFVGDVNGEAVLTLSDNASGGNTWTYLSGFILSSGTPITIYDDEIVIANIEVK